MIYAKSEFYIVAATYFYYVGLDEPMLQELNRLDPDELEQDSAQYLNYLYNIGSGGAIVKGTENEINQAEFDRLISCYMLASDPSPLRYPYWQANALQSISEHLRKGEVSDSSYATTCLPSSISTSSRCQTICWQATLPSVPSTSFRATEMFIRLPEPTVRWLNVSGISMIILLRSTA